MKIVAKYDEIEPACDDEGEIQWVEGPCYQLVKCPACGKLQLWSYHFHSSDDDTPVYKTLFPAASKTPLGLPPEIQKEYEAALQVRNISPNAYGVLMGRILEMVCEDRKAAGGFLGQKLADLAKRNEIPSKLVAVANNFKDLRNLGAHAALGSLTAGEVPILEDLSRAILEYVYSAPFLADQAEKRLKQLKQPKAKPPSK